jgi:hypothetical protein
MNLLLLNERRRLWQSSASSPSLRAQRGNLVFHAISREVFDVRGRWSVTLQLCSGLLHFVRNDVTLDCSHLPTPPHFIAVLHHCHCERSAAIQLAMPLAVKFVT